MALYLMLLLPFFIWFFFREELEWFLINNFPNYFVGRAIYRHCTEFYISDGHPIMRGREEARRHPLYGPLISYVLDNLKYEDALDTVVLVRNSKNVGELAIKVHEDDSYERVRGWVRVVNIALIKGAVAWYILHWYIFYAIILILTCI